MKSLILLVTMSLTTAAFSQTVYLDSANVNVDVNPSTLVKTSLTPEVVNLNVKVPTTVERCDEADMRVTTDLVTDGARCGYDTVRYNCGGGYYGGPVGPGRTGPRYNPPRGPRGPVGPGRGRVSVPAGRRYNPARVNNTCVDYRARTCRVERRYCSNPYYVTVDKFKTFTVEFKKFTKDASISFGLDQNYNLELEVLGMNASCIDKTIYGKNGVKTGAKLKLKRRCR